MCVRVSVCVFFFVLCPGPFLPSLFILSLILVFVVFDAQSCLWDKESGEEEAFVVVEVEGA